MIKPTKLELNTDYRETGNSTGAALDTLAIAVDGRDSNDIDDDNFDSLNLAEQYVLDNYDYESDMLKKASKKELKTWLTNPTAQANALKEFTENQKESLYNGHAELQNKPLYQAVQEARDAQADSDYHEWIYGDHRHWDGILAMAERRYGQYTGIEFTESKGDIYAAISDETVQAWLDAGDIDSKAMKDAVSHLERLINTDAEAAYNKRMADNTRRRAERERMAAYKKEQAAEREERRQTKLKKLIKSL